jgi:hypothetical protein
MFENGIRYFIQDDRERIWTKIFTENEMLSETIFQIIA